MKINTADGSCHLVEADVIEALETGSGDGADAMIRHEEILLPPHEEVLSLRKILEAEIRPLRLLRQRPPCLKPTPMLHIDFVVGAPLGMARLKGILVSNYLALEVGGESRMIVSKTWLRTSRFSKVPCVDRKLLPWMRK